MHFSVVILGIWFTLSHPSLIDEKGKRNIFNSGLLIMLMVFKCFIIPVFTLPP